MLYELGQLQQLKSYADELDLIEKNESELTDDNIRAKGLSLIKKLKIGVEKAKDPSFEND